MRTNAIKVCILILLIVACLAILGRTGRCQDPEVKPPVVQLTPTQTDSLRILIAEYNEAAAKKEAADLRLENAQLKYMLAVARAKDELKLGPDYEWKPGANGNGSFVIKTEQAKAMPPAPKP